MIREQDFLKDFAGGKFLGCLMTGLSKWSTTNALIFYHNLAGAQAFQVISALGLKKMSESMQAMIRYFLLPFAIFLYYNLIPYTLISSAKAVGCLHI